MITAALVAIALFLTVLAAALTVRHLEQEKR